MISGGKNLISEQYLNWTESWGLTLAYAITGSVEKAEKLLAETMVALMVSQISTSDDVVRAAALLWELGQRDVSRSLGDETFFKMPAVTRTIVILKVRARFSQAQIAATLHLNIKEVQDQLENARLVFSSGRPWIETSISSTMGPACLNMTQIGTHKYELPDAFSQYVDQDLDLETSRNFNSHLLNCHGCRNLFTKFKTKYRDWIQSVPMIDLDQKQRKYFSHVIHMAFDVNTRQGPSPWPGVRKVLEKPKNWIWIFGFIVLAILLYHYI